MFILEVMSTFLPARKMMVMMMASRRKREPMWQGGVIVAVNGFVNEENEVVERIVDDHGGEDGRISGMIHDDDGVSEKARADGANRILVAHDGGVNEGGEVVEIMVYDHVGGDGGISGMVDDNDGVSEEARADVKERVLVAINGFVNEGNEVV